MPLHTELSLLFQIYSGRSLPRPPRARCRAAWVFLDIRPGNLYTISVSDRFSLTFPAGESTTFAPGEMGRTDREQPDASLRGGGRAALFFSRLRWFFSEF